MLNQPPSLPRRTYEAPGGRFAGRAEEAVVLIAIPLAVLSGMLAIAAAGVYIWLARGLPSIEWARHYRAPGQHGLERRRAADGRVLTASAGWSFPTTAPQALEAGGDRQRGQGLLRARRRQLLRPDARLYQTT